MKLTIVTCASTVNVPGVVVHMTGAYTFNPGGLYHPTHAVANFAAQLAGAKKNDRELVAFCADGSILNFVGGLIETNRIKTEDVEVVLYHSETESTTHSYDKGGYLNETWPYGVLIWDTDVGHGQFDQIANS